MNVKAVQGMTAWSDKGTESKGKTFAAKEKFSNPEFIIILVKHPLAQFLM